MCDGCWDIAALAPRFENLREGSRATQTTFTKIHRKQKLGQSNWPPGNWTAKLLRSAPPPPPESQHDYLYHWDLLNWSRDVITLVRSDHYGMCHCPLVNPWWFEEASQVLDFRFIHGLSVVHTAELRWHSGIDEPKEWVLPTRRRVFWRNCVHDKGLNTCTKSFVSIEEHRYWSLVTRATGSNTNTRSTNGAELCAPVRGCLIC